MIPITLSNGFHIPAGTIVQCNTNILDETPPDWGDPHAFECGGTMATSWRHHGDIMAEQWQNGMEGSGRVTVETRNMKEDKGL